MDFKPGRPLFAKQRRTSFLRLRWVFGPLVLISIAATAWMITGGNESGITEAPPVSATEGHEIRLRLPPDPSAQTGQPGTTATPKKQPAAGAAGPVIADKTIRQDISKTDSANGTPEASLTEAAVEGNPSANIGTPASGPAQGLPGPAPRDSAPSSPVSASSSAVVASIADDALAGTLLALEPATATGHKPTQNGKALSALTEPAWQILTVGPGDSLSALFSRAGLRAGDLHALINSSKDAKALTRIHPGETIHYRIDAEKRLLGMKYQLNENNMLLLERQGSTFKASQESLPSRVVLRESQGIINSSLFMAGKDAGLEDRLIMELAGIFAWDIDFALDIRSGDSFALLYEALYRDGKFLRSGNIMGAEFVSRGKSYRAIRHVDSNGVANYYSPEGRSMRQAFLRSPVDFHRISSHFNPNRLHPVLGTTRPHRGVDYAAPTGTPIRAAGDGRIVHLGRKGGYGHTIIIQHGTRYSTLYAHMSRYASKLSAGSRVRQGQVIGYVGMTGTATGPHLHYEFLVDGTHRDPVRVKLPDAEPIADRYRAEFKASAAPLVARLNSMRPQQVALQQND